MRRRSIPTTSRRKEPGPEPPIAPSPRSLRGLDWFVFFVADVQTGFGPFVSVYLTTQKWTQHDIGLVLSAAALASLIGQMPGGALVDAAKSERFVAGCAIVVICLSALTYAALPVFTIVFAGSVLHALASCVLGPAMAAISLGLVGPAAIGERLGRNARFASVGNGLAAAAMGACGYFLSPRSVFVVTVLLLVPALIALREISNSEIDAERAHGAKPRRRKIKPPIKASELLQNIPLLTFAACLLAVPSGQCRHAAVGRQRRHHAFEPVGDPDHRRLHRRAADPRRGAIAVGRNEGADLGPPAAAADRLRLIAHSRLFIRARNRSRHFFWRCRSSTASRPPCSR